MNLENVYYIFRNFCEGYNKEMTVEDFNEYLIIADFEFLKECKEEDEGKTTSMYTEALRPFRVTSTISLTSGSGTLPTGFYYPKRVYYDLSGSDKPLERVTDEEWEYRIENTVINPDVNWPIYLVDSTTIKVRPISITSIEVVYIKKNLGSSQPKIAFSLSNGVNSYDSGNSVQLLWSEDNYIDIIRHMLKLVGISVSNFQVAQVMDQQQSIRKQ